jgi:threonine dehydrogenase-like Zn-dependent dehydrogenase
LWTGVRRYTLDGSDEYLRRLLSISQVTAGTARAASRRIGIQKGWNAIGCGYGPLGGLAVMAEMVGLDWRVVGVDSSEPTVQRARSVAAALQLDVNIRPSRGTLGRLRSSATACKSRSHGFTEHLQLDNVEVVRGNTHEFDAATLGGPFDMAFALLFLMHQADLVHTLTRISGLLRPGW